MSIGYCFASVLLAAACASVSFAAGPATRPAASLTINVWPDGKMPGVPATQPEHAEHAEKQDVHITNVSQPTIAFYKAVTDRPAPTVIVCPGGGYQLLAYDKEGVDIAYWLNSIGINAAVLKYRCPGNRQGAFQDIQRAMRLVRSKADEWNSDPQRVGVIGFSAGGHLCARLSNNFDDVAYPYIDAADQLSCRPDFTMLVYPAYLQKDGKIVPELKLPANLPPTLMIHALDDHTFIEGSKVYHAALDAAKLSNELHLYPTGGHGHGMRTDKAVSVWPNDAKEWLVRIGILKPAS